MKHINGMAFIALLIVGILSLIRPAAEGFHIIAAWCSPTPTHCHTLDSKGLPEGWSVKECN